MRDQLSFKLTIEIYKLLIPWLPAKPHSLHCLIFTYNDRIHMFSLLLSAAPTEPPSPDLSCRHSHSGYVHNLLFPSAPPHLELSLIDACWKLLVKARKYLAGVNSVCVEGKDGYSRILTGICPLCQRLVQEVPGMAQCDE